MLIGSMSWSFVCRFGYAYSEVICKWCYWELPCNCETGFSWRWEESKDTLKCRGFPLSTDITCPFMKTLCPLSDIPGGTDTGLVVLLLGLMASLLLRQRGLSQDSPIISFWAEDLAAVWSKMQHNVLTVLLLSAASLLSSKKRTLHQEQLNCKDIFQSVNKTIMKCVCQNWVINMFHCSHKNRQRPLWSW